MVWTIPSPSCVTLHKRGACRLVSTPSSPYAKLGSVLPLVIREVSPNLTGVPPTITHERALLSLASYSCSTPLSASIHPSRLHANLYCGIYISISCDTMLSMAYILLRERVQSMRRQGNSINDIALKTKAPKSTVSYWCRDIALSPLQIERLAKKSRLASRIGALHAAEHKRALRLRAVEEEMRNGRDDVGRLSKRDLFVLGAALYWGEGYKKGNEECGLTNSDPDIIRAFIHWLEEIYDIPRSRLIARVSVNRLHEKRLRLIERHWSRVTGIPLSQFSRPSVIMSTSRKVYANPGRHVGTIRIKVRRATALRRRILGSIAEIGRQAPSAPLTRRN